MLSGTMTFPWLEYSFSKDAMFCYPCWIFTNGSGKAEKTFTLHGYCDWKHASGKKGALQCHDRCRCKVHKNAMVAWEECKLNSSSGTSVAHQLDKTRMLQIRKNHHYHEPQ